MKSSIGSIVLFLFLFSGFAMAQMDISLERGWNLVSVPGEGELWIGTCSHKVVGSVYVPYLGKFMGFSELENSMDNFGSFLVRRSFWVYSYQDCKIEFREKRKASYSELWLDDGWTFAPVTEDMVGKTWKEIAAGCSIRSIYTWDSRWKSFSKSKEIAATYMGQGFLVKSSSSCMLG